MTALYIICNILVVISALVVVATVLLQAGNTQGLGAIAGGAETFFGKNKAKTFEGKLELATKISAVVFIVLTIVMLLIYPSAH
ncbi:MAG: preprotein translocase subunit SecG [Eubacteriales bacterium]|nr:preprotein translocase subunit SecG [Eubacteriales bacterium]MDD3881387.1 preprotein translocase subunit SecG [Eubacteriales bacterium]MDD4513074.1 preprotein translocase subunit SecG [Eubacteriales bacterium]